MASSRSALPPPFELRRLFQPVFAPPAPSTQPGPSKNPVIRSVDGHGQLVWVGSSDGRVKGLDINPISSYHNPLVSDSNQTSSLDHQTHPSDPSSSSRPLDLPPPEDPIQSSCFQDYQVFPLSDKSKPKPIEKLILVPMVALAIILSEGTVSFHSITDLQPCPTSSFPPIKAVSSVTLDEHTYDPDKSSNRPDVLMCVIKKKSIFLYLLSMDGAQPVHEVSFASAAFQSLLRGSTLLLSDIEQYYLISLDQQPPQVIPLLPISQTSSSSIDDHPATDTSQATRHRPSMAALPNSREFLLASHTGSTCLGIFVSSSGEPSRGTLEWPSNPRSIAVDVNHVLALLFNGTIEVHLLQTQELLHVTTLPSNLDPRSLASVKFGISLPGESYTSQLNTVPVSLERSSTSSSPPGKTTVRSESTLSAATQSRILLVGRDGLYALATRTFLAEVERLMGDNRWDEALAVAVEHSALQQRSRSALQSSVHRARSENHGQINQLNYVYQRIALHHLLLARFDEASQLWFKGRGDPRCLLVLFPLLYASSLCRSDQVFLFHGVVEAVGKIKSADELITAHLSQQNDPAPQLVESESGPQPETDAVVEDADLKQQLLAEARHTLLKYLHRWKRDRLIQGGASDGNRHLNSVIDTALVELLSERRPVDPDAYATLKQLLERPNSCDFAHVENILLKNKCFCILCKLYLKRNDVPKAFSIWAKLHDKRFSDEDFHEDLDQMASVLLNYNEVDFVLKYAIWMAPLDHVLAVKILVESKVSDDFDDNAAFQTLSGVSSEAAEQYLEKIILRESQRASEDSKRRDAGGNAEDSKRLVDLRTRLVVGYLHKIKRLLGGSPERPSAVMEFFRSLVEDFMASSSTESTTPASFVEYFLQRSAADVADHDASSPLAEAIRTRAKLIVCLDLSPAEHPYYDAPKTRSILEEMGGSAEVLALERAMVYSKIGLHRPALSLLAITLKDIRSAETYCLQGGRILVSGQASSLMRVGRMTWANPGAGDDGRGRAAGALLGQLLDLLMSAAAPSEAQVKTVLLRHPGLVPLDASLARLPARWALDRPLAQYLARSLRRYQHLAHESALRKSIALGHKISLALAWNHHRAQTLTILPEHQKS